MSHKINTLGTAWECENPDQYAWLQYLSVLPSREPNNNKSIFVHQPACVNHYLQSTLCQEFNVILWSSKVNQHVPLVQTLGTSDPSLFPMLALLFGAPYWSSEPLIHNRIIHFLWKVSECTRWNSNEYQSTDTCALCQKSCCSRTSPVFVSSIEDLKRLLTEKI